MTEVLTTSYLEQWVELSAKRQKLEKEAKKLKVEARKIELEAQAEALDQLAQVNGLIDVDPLAYPLALSQARTKTFEFNPLFKIQVSFTTELIEDDAELVEVCEALAAERETLAKANKSEVDVLLAEKALVEQEIAALQTNPTIDELTERLDDLKQRLTLPVVKTLSLKAA